MVRPVKRRNSSVMYTKYLIEAIKYIRYQKQIPNIERISRYMNREYGLADNFTEKHLHYAVKDNIIHSYMAVGKKGSMTGVEQEGFKIPEDEEDMRGDHDWYCLECHTAGDVLPCSDCWRVFHPSCTMEEWTGPKFTCSICKAARQKKKIKRRLLNILLGYTIQRMKEKTKELHKIGHREQEKKFEKFFVYKRMDLNHIEMRVDHQKYKTLEEFLADVQLIYHNVYLMYGEEKKGMLDLAQILVRDCKYDIDEVRQCQNCYYMSNAKPKDWFCQPCNPPHELVYAKLKGYCHWPAKVIRYVADKYDCRFFGAPHQRALIPKDMIKPIDINIKTLTVKRSSGFVKACEELARHQKLLAEKRLTDETSDSESPGESENGPERMEEEEEEEDTSPLEVSSTSVSPMKKRICLKAPTPEDSNLVTSSEDKVSKVITLNASSQTISKLTKSQSIQTDQETKPDSTDSKAEPALQMQCSPDASDAKSGDEEAPLLTPSIEANGGKSAEIACNCSEKYEKEISDLKAKLENSHQDDKEKALEELSDRLQKDFEEDKQQAVSRAMANMNREIERTKQSTEEKCKKEYMEEMKKLAAKHKDAISATKRKQWCYNCEEEAMYHCCWNTSYCSVKCQQEHWHKEHKRVCRRKR
ncbi:zinc finger MYND domain-containing protein 11-like isoform X1 [Ostrea edulis]|uniref:zinc finger MYND domain-containing protein 11-like isoform X1 n=2 Tax=Ostrea edulis TaxID=37623 RepID=UPI00209635B7|nr:zinc finger MYND domain-containing protein 11-like isoform X1 [Ostrea edulis]